MVAVYLQSITIAYGHKNYTRVDQVTHTNYNIY